MSAYVINAHGFELLHTSAIKLNANEHVIMLCNWGCSLIVRNLFSEYIYKHVSYARDAGHLYELLLNPGAVAKKYEVLDFMKHIFCVYGGPESSFVPEIQYRFDDPTFRTGVYRLPISTVPRVSGKDLENPKKSINITSDYITPPENTMLSSIIGDIRAKCPNGFTLVSFACRDFISAIPNPVKLRDADRPR